MQNSQSLEDVLKSLKKELTEVRQESLQATRQGDFMKVARLTTRSAGLNKSIIDCENQLMAMASRS